MKLRTLEVKRYQLEEPLVLPPMPGCERYIHPLVGSANVTIESEKFNIGGRRTVFHPTSEGVYDMSSGATLIDPVGAFDVLVATAESSSVVVRDPVRVSPTCHEIGHANHRRTVYEILGADGPSMRLRCGETFNEKGGWSSWPPHSFDSRPELAPEFEEIFVPFMRPSGGLAMLRRSGTYRDGTEVNDAVAVKSGQMLELPLGSHPIVGGPDTELMYVFFYVSPIAKQYGKWADDAGSYA